MTSDARPDDRLREGIFAGDNPFEIARRWLMEARAAEVNDPDAVALSTVDARGLPNARIVLMREITDEVFSFFTNYESAKGQEIEASGKCAFVMHWKSLRRQIRVRGDVARSDPARSDAYYQGRALGSRIGAWASEQSRPLEDRETLMARVDQYSEQHGDTPTRPPFWGGYDITPTEIEFWADGASRLHDRFQWCREAKSAAWKIIRLNP